MLSKNASLAYWNLATTGEEAHAKELEKSEIELKTYLSNRELFEEIKETLETHQEGLDPLTQRQLKLIFNEMFPSQLPKEAIEEEVKREVEIESIYANFRPKIDGKEFSTNDILDVLKKAWILKRGKKHILLQNLLGK